MALNDDIQSAMKGGNAVIGKRESLKAIKSSSPKVVVIAENIPVSLEKEVRHSAEVSGVDVQVFHGSSSDLGTICGKPFPVSTLVIKV
jgi:large subunit ribosomal protein L30e